MTGASGDALVVFDSRRPQADEARRRLLPFLRQFGVPHRTWDLADGGPAPIADPALLVIAHAGVELGDGALAAAAGIVSFDPAALGVAGATVDAAELALADVEHYVTRCHEPGERLALAAPIAVPAAAEGWHALVRAGEGVMVACRERAGVRAVTWAGLAWASPDVLGPLAGLDDLVWRSIVWCARKPFVMRGMPAFATLRVDDCVGDAGHYRGRPFAWLDACAAAGFVPWLGFFTHMSEAAAAVMAERVAAGDVTATFHGDYLFGRCYASDPPGADGIRAALDRWHERCGRFPLSRYFVPHAYDVTTEALAVMRERGTEMIGIPYAPDSTGGAERRDVPWLQLGPYREHEAGCDGLAWDGGAHRSLYYAGYVAVPGGPPLFDLLTEIRDVNGYEWFRYGAGREQLTDVEGAIVRGTRILERCYQSQVVGTLFTHESSWRDCFIAAVPPAAWDEMILGVASNLARHAPRFVSLDEAAAYARALHDSTLSSVRVAGGAITLRFEGRTDRETWCRVFSGGAGGAPIAETEAAIPRFEAGSTVTVRVPPAARPAPVSIFAGERPTRTVAAEGRDFGLAFRALVPGDVVALRVWNDGQAGRMRGRLWHDGACIAGPFEWDLDAAVGWTELQLPAPVPLAPGAYLASVAPLDGQAVPSLPGGLHARRRGDHLACEREAARLAAAEGEPPTIAAGAAHFFRDVVFAPGAAP